MARYLCDGLAMTRVGMLFQQRQTELLRNPPLFHCLQWPVVPLRAYL